MDLFLDLHQKDGVWIDGSHRVFEKSEFEGLHFRVKIKPLTRTELRKVRREAETSTRSFDQDIALPMIFMNCCLDWELKDGHGQSIPFSEENKKILVEQFPVLTNLVAAACLDAQARAAEVREEEVKNLSASGAGA
ncbi:MAG: hypothetical protein AB1847_11365 [bacterium]